jgi:hypothetical protein
MYSVLAEDNPAILTPIFSLTRTSLRSHHPRPRPRQYQPPPPNKNTTTTIIKIVSVLIMKFSKRAAYKVGGSLNGNARQAANVCTTSLRGTGVQPKLFETLTARRLRSLLTKAQLALTVASIIGTDQPNPRVFQTCGRDGLQNRLKYCL